VCTGFDIPTHDCPISAGSGVHSSLPFTELDLAQRLDRSSKWVLHEPGVECPRRGASVRTRVLLIGRELGAGLPQLGQKQMRVVTKAVFAARFVCDHAGKRAARLE
jgi:hypothetical protein